MTLIKDEIKKKFEELMNKVGKESEKGKVLYLEDFKGYIYSGIAFFGLCVDYEKVMFAAVLKSNEETFVIPYDVVFNGIGYDTIVAFDEIRKINEEDRKKIKSLVNKRIQQIKELSEEVEQLLEI